MSQAVPTVAEAAVTTAPTAPGADPPNPKVLTYNSFLLSKALYPNWGQDHRAKEIPAASFYQGNDVVVVQEAFDNSASEALKSNSAAQYPYQTPVMGRSTSGWDATSGAYSSLTPEDGGVTMLSKWPVLRQEQYVYKEACGADSQANKGFVYAVLSVNGAKVHVVGTHAQATDPSCATGEPARIRSTQFKEMDAFLDGKDIPADEQVIVAGDFNVDSHSDEYAKVLADGGLADATRTGHPYSFDTQDNSIASERYPTDPRENLDHVLHRADHARPSAWTNEVVRQRSAPWSVTSGGKVYTYTDLSDHYPVVAGR
ncbi:sphingomyelin phosphodiesterase [Streptomyces boluensis]|nr:sphingomyelin phosphodiesterase [Streptomyces boluensis]